MIKAPAFANRRIAVLGLARSGLAAARSLAASGAQVTAWDDQPERRAAAAGPGIRFADFSALDWRDIDGLVVSPGIPIRLPAPHPMVKAAQENGVAVFGDIEVFAHARLALPAHILVAITGTNGKSTTTALIGHIVAEAGLPVAVGGNIGAAVLGLDPLPAGGVYVLELSSYQIEQTQSLACDIAILLNLSPDHLERHGDMAGYAAAKAHLFAMQAPAQRAVIAVDDPYSRGIADCLGDRLVAVSGQTALEYGVYVEDGVLYDALAGDRVVISRQADWPALIGRHNGQNAAAAAACARLLGIDAKVIDQALRGFAGLAHRLQPVGVLGGIRFINDSKATNSDAAATALGCFERPVHWIVGGRAKSNDLGAIADQLQRVEKAYLVGEAAGLFAGLLADRVATEDCGTIGEAVARAVADIGDRDGVVLLAPACASFDQYGDFEARGADFTAHVQALIAGRAA